MSASGSRPNSGVRRSSSQPARRRPGRRPPGVDFLRECSLCARATSCPPTEHVTEYSEAYKWHAFTAAVTATIAHTQSQILTMPSDDHNTGNSLTDKNQTLFDYWDEIREWATENNTNYIYVPGLRSSMRRRSTQLKMEGSYSFLTNYGNDYVLFRDAWRPPLIKPTSLLQLQGDHQFLPEYRDKFVEFLPEKRMLFKKPTTLKLEGEIPFVTESTSAYTLSELPIAGLPMIKRPQRKLPPDIVPSDKTTESRDHTHRRVLAPKNESFLPAIDAKVMKYENRRVGNGLHPAVTSPLRRVKSGNVRRHDLVLPVLTSSNTTKSHERPRKRSRRQEIIASKPIFKMNVDKAYNAKENTSESAARIRWRLNAEKSVNFEGLPIIPRPVARSFLVLEHSLLGDSRNKWMRD